MIIAARPEPLALDPAETAVVVVDMQNDFGAPKGMFDRAGVPIDGIQGVVEPIARVLRAARAAEMQIVYLQMQFDGALAKAGAPDAPNYLVHRRLGVGDAVFAPEGRAGRILIEGTWNTEIVAPLAPRDGDNVVPKHRYSGFFETDLDATLRELGVTTLVFTGCTTSVCVDSTLRDAFFRDYRCLLLEDCVAQPPLGRDLALHDATVLVIESLFGWVSDSAAFEAAAAASPAPASVAG